MWREMAVLHQSCVPLGSFVYDPRYILRKTLRERDHLEDLGVDGRIILRWIFKKWAGVGMDWVDVAQDRNTWRALVNVVMNFRVP